MSNQLVVGVDGGATKTLALVADTDGQVKGVARGPGSNLAPSDAVAVIADVVAAAAAEAEVSASDLAAAAFSLAGADCDDDIGALESSLDVLSLGRRRRVVNDSVGALYAGASRGNAVAAVCGTGFAVAARSSSDELWYGGHWTDWGSGRKRGCLGGKQMAEAVVRAVVDEALELGAPTVLTKLVLDSFGAVDTTEVLHLVTTRGVRHREIRADLTNLLLRSANEGDAVAVEIVSDFGAAMGEFAGVGARRVGIEKEPFELVLLGGVLRETCPPLREALLGALYERAPFARPVDSALEPLHGAVLIALELLGESARREVRTTLARTTLPASFFATGSHQTWEGDAWRKSAHALPR